MSTEPGPQVRFAQVIEMTALRSRADPVLLPSFSNDSWLVDDPSRGRCVLRICWRGDRGRLITEAKVGRALPRAVGYPDVLGYGWTRDEHDLSWMVTRRLKGVPLSEAWPGLSAAQRARAGRDVASRLRSLHRWRPSATLSDRLLSWPRGTRIGDIVGATISPLPWPRVCRLAHQLRQARESDAELIGAALDWLAGHEDLAPELDRPGQGIAHGDLQLANLWWDGARVSGLLDLEWARLAPPYLDLSRVVDEAAAERGLGESAAHQQLFDLLIAAYPELAVPRLAERLRYSRLAYQLRQLVGRDSPARGQEPPPDHPLALIAELLDGSAGQDSE